MALSRGTSHADRNLLKALHNAMSRIEGRTVVNHLASSKQPTKPATVDSNPLRSEELALMHATGAPATTSLSA